MVREMPLLPRHEQDEAELIQVYVGGRQGMGYGLDSEFFRAKFE
jgi:hypothetical protein